MKRGELAVLAISVVVGLAAAIGVVLIGTGGDDGNATPRPAADQRRFPPTSERGPEAENHSLQDLPAVDRAARSFLATYLPLIYGKNDATADKLRRAAPRLIAQLKADPGRVPPAQLVKTPRIVRLAVIRKGANRALATAQIKDSPESPYALIFTLEDTLKGWVVIRIGPT